MRTITYLMLTIVGIIAVVGLVIAEKACNTGSRMADQTIFNAEKHVYSYEEFHREFAQYQEYKKQKTEVEASIKDLEAKGITNGQRYDNLATEADGARNMMKRIAAEYNAMSEISYQKVWKSQGLPERLD